MTGPLTTLRSGLPRRSGGEPWPAPNTLVETSAEETLTAPQSAVAQPAAMAEPPATPQPVAMAEPNPTDTGSERLEAGHPPAVESRNGATLRRGLPRTAGGSPWPPADAQPAAGIAAPIGQLPPSALAEAVAAESPVATEPTAATESTATTQQLSSGSTPASSSKTPAGKARAASAPGMGNTDTVSQSIRQGLPRVLGGQPWPAASEVHLQVADAVVHPEVSATSPAEVAVPDAMEKAVPDATEKAEVKVTNVSKVPAEQRKAAGSPTSSAVAAKKARTTPAWLQSTLGKSIAAAVILLVFAGAAVLAARWFLGTDTGQAFLLANPGEYHLPEMAPVGFPSWLGWQHFMNAFLMVLIIRSGLQIRGEKRPSAYWTPKSRNGAKVSLTVWFHQSLDLLWLVNGVIFIILLFATGQWVRVIPTSWEVFPNAVSAGLQYLSLDWPTDNGWVNYNSLQQLAYCATIFVAAPLAAISGFRMSGLWPKQAKKLSSLYPIEVARKIHVPVMVYFVSFIAIHVILVMSTGALRNLNHMYAAQGSVDPGVYANNWFGFWMFFLSLLVIGGAVAASRAMVLAPIASLFGKVSSR